MKKKILIGIAIAAVAVIILVAVILFLLFRKGGKGTGAYPPLPSDVTNDSDNSVFDGISGKIYRTRDGRLITWMYRNTYTSGIYWQNSCDGQGGCSSPSCHGVNCPPGDLGCPPPPRNKPCSFGGPCNKIVPGVSHAASMAFLPDGTLVAVWFSGVCEGYNRVSTVVSYLSPGSEAWTKPEIIPDNTHEGYSNQNPVLHYDNYNGVLRLFFPSQPNQCRCDGIFGEACAQIFEQVYQDGSWGPKKVAISSTTNGVYIKNKVVQFDKSTWWLPGYIFKDHNKNWDHQQSVVWETSDGGGSYQRVLIPGSEETAQPSIFRFNGKFYAFMRDRHKRDIFYSTSGDGRTWSDAARTNIPNNDSALQGTVYYDGSLLLIMNPVSGKSRAQLGIWRCPSGKDPADVDNYKKFSLDFSDEDFDFSYPWLVYDSDHNVYVSYTFKTPQSAVWERLQDGSCNKDPCSWIKWQMLPAEWIKSRLY